MIKKASKAMSFPRIIIEGKTGAGKSATALRIAQGIKEFISENEGESPDICAIDTENGRLLQYQGSVEFSDRIFEFLHDDIFDDDIPESVDGIAVISKMSPLNIVAKIRRIKNSYPSVKIIIIDSVSLAWDSIMDRATDIEMEGDKKYNAFSKWRHPETKPSWKKMIQEIMSFNGAVIFTIREKMKHEMKKVGDTTVVVRLGIDPIAQPDTEFEGTVILESCNDDSDDSVAFRVIKDNSGMGLKGKVINKPDEEFGYSIMKYLYSSGGNNKLYSAKPLESTEVRNIRARIDANMEKILANKAYKEAFEEHLSLEIYPICYNLETLKKALGNVVKISNQQKADK